MTDNWRTMPEGKELDKLIAQKLDYRVYSLNDNPWGHVIKGPAYFLWRGEIKTEAMWHEMFKLPLRTHFQADECWPDAGAFSDDLETAVWLLDDYKSWSLTFDQDYGVHHRVGYSVTINGACLCEFAPTPCLAVCRAWLALKELEESKE